MTNCTICIGAAYPYPGMSGGGNSHTHNPEFPLPFIRFVQINNGFYTCGHTIKMIGALNLYNPVSGYALAYQHMVSNIVENDSYEYINYQNKVHIVYNIPSPPDSCCFGKRMITDYQIVTQQNTQLFDKDNQLKQQETQLINKDRQIKQQQVRLNQLENQLSDKNKQINQQQTQLNSQSRLTQFSLQKIQIKQLENLLSDKNKQIALLNDRIEQRTNELKSHGNRLTQFDIQIKQQQIQIDQQETQLIGIQPDLIQLSDLYYGQVSNSIQLEAELQLKTNQIAEQEENVKQLLAALETSHSKQGLTFAISNYFKR